MDAAIRCKKIISDGSFSCRQCADSPCGCLSKIVYPSVESILSKGLLEHRANFIDKIKESIHSRQAALALGAGISVPSRMPRWSGLISQMMGYAIQYRHISPKFSGVTDNDEDPFDKLINNIDAETNSDAIGSRIMRLTDAMINNKLQLLTNVNALESAEYVAQYFDDVSSRKEIRNALPEASICAMVRKIINHSLSPDDLLRNLCDDSTENYAKYANAIKEKDESLYQDIAKLSTIFSVSYLMWHNKGIRKSMTYNYDPLVQEHMINLYNADFNNIITHPGKWSNKSADIDTRELYHVHGFVAGKRHLSTGLSDVYPSDSGTLILSEDSYYRVEQEEAYNWSSSVQSYFLNKFNCIFIGFSAEDYNFKRILRQKGRDSLEKGPAHFLVLTIDDWITRTYEDVCRYHLYEKTEVTHSTDTNLIDEIYRDTVLILQNILMCRERYWSRYNIFPIWVTIKEIPELLVSLIE